MSVEIAALLAAQGPMTSGALAAALAANLSISPAAARKRIERRAPPVRAVKLVLPRGAQFLYLESQYASPKFWDRLAEALMEGNGAYARVDWFGDLIGDAVHLGPVSDHCLNIENQLLYCECKANSQNSYHLFGSELRKTLDRHIDTFGERIVWEDRWGKVVGSVQRKSLKFRPYMRMKKKHKADLIIYSSQGAQ